LALNFANKWRSLSLCSSLVVLATVKSTGERFLVTSKRKAGRDDSNGILKPYRNIQTDAASTATIRRRAGPISAHRNIGKNKSMVTGADVARSHVLTVLAEASINLPDQPVFL
jgi:hypothetical protein